MKIGVKVRVPRKVFSSSEFVESIKNAQNKKTIPDVIKLFESTVSTWNHKPDFSSRRIDTSVSLGVFIFPSGENKALYSLVSYGSPPHVIRPRKASLLRFMPAYRSATLPRVLTSRTALRGGDFVKAKVVNHPGFQAREFPETIKEFYEPKFAEDMQAAIREAAKS